MKTRRLKCKPLSIFRSILLLGGLALLTAALPVAVGWADLLPVHASSPGQASQHRNPLSSPKPPAVADLPMYTEMHTPDGAQVCGEIASDAVWTALTGVYTVTCDVHVRAGVTLQIEPGVVVQFQHSSDDLIVSGALRAIGTEAAPINFRPTASVQPGSWGRVAFLTGSTGVLDHVRLKYGGHEDGMVYLASEHVQVLNSLVQLSADTGIVIQTASHLDRHVSSRSREVPAVASGAGTSRPAAPNVARRVFLPAVRVNVGGYGSSTGPLISNTQLISNTGVYGGGLYNDTGSPTIQGNTFVGNAVDDAPGIPAGLGGGLYNDSGSPIIRDNAFVRNGRSYAFGGGLYNNSGSPIIQNNTFAENNAGYRASGGGLYNESGNPTIENNAFVGNYAAQDGGGLLNQFGSPLIRSNSFTGNAASGRTAYGYGGGLCNHSGSPMIEDNLFAGNTINGVYGPGRGGGLYNAGADTTIQNNVFKDNTAHGPGGGLYTIGNATIRNNTFSGNTIASAFFAGGGLASGWGSPTIINNIFANNMAPVGGGLAIEAGSAVVDYNAVWRNTGGDYAGVAAGPHDLAVDPLFVDAAAGNFHLAAGSPLIDAGDPAHYPPTDFDGDLRPAGTGPDIGADEFQPTVARR